MHGDRGRRATGEKNFTVGFFFSAFVLQERRQSDKCAGKWLKLYNHRKVERENKPPETSSNPEIHSGKEWLSPGPWPALMAPQSHLCSPLDSSSSPGEEQQEAGQCVIWKQLSEASPVGAWHGGEHCRSSVKQAGKAVLENRPWETFLRFRLRKQMCWGGFGFGFKVKAWGYGSCLTLMSEDMIQSS